PRRCGRRASRAVRRGGGGGRARGRRVRGGPDRGQRAPPAVVAAGADAVRGPRARARPRADTDPVRSGAMIALLGALVVVGVPVAGLVALLKVLDFLERRRAATVARQIEVTDAIHREFGAIVAPTVRRARGGWRVVLPMDVRLAEAARVVELAAVTLGPAVEVAVVAPWPPSRRPAAQSKERMASAISA